jgi:hypothetical protein
MTINVEVFLWLLIFFQFKHFFADYVLQNVWMLQKSRAGWDFVAPLAIHCGVHAALTLAVALYVNSNFWWLAVLDFAVHFTMDRIKAGPRYLGRFHDPHSKAFWVAFGFDQMIHHLTHLYIAWELAANVARAI